MRTPLKVNVISVRGDRDAIRWGDLSVDGVVRRWHMCLLSGQVSLWTCNAGRHQLAVEDRDKRHLTAARKALAEHFAV